MNSRIFVAIFAVTALASFAHAQQRPAPPKGPKPTPAEVQRVVAMITADKAKTQIYCDVGKLEDQMSDAAQKKDNKTLEELGKKLSAMEQQLGPEYNNLMGRLQQIDPNSKDGKQLEAAFEPLDKQCPK